MLKNTFTEWDKNYPTFKQLPINNLLSQFKSIATTKILTTTNGTELLKGMKDANCLSSRKFCESLNGSHSATLNRTCSNLLELFRFVKIADDYFNSWLYNYAYDGLVLKNAPHFESVITTDSAYKFLDDHYLDSVYEVCGNITYETPRHYIDLCNQVNNQTGAEYMKDELTVDEDKLQSKQSKDNKTEILYEDTQNDNHGLLFLCESYDLSTARPEIVKMCKQFTEMSIDTLDDLSGNANTYGQYQNDDGGLNQYIGYGDIDDYETVNKDEDGLNDNYHYNYYNDASYLDTKQNETIYNQKSYKDKKLISTTAKPKLDNNEIGLSSSLLETMVKFMAKYTDVELDNICKSLDKYTPKNLSDFCVEFKKETNLPLLHVYHKLLNPNDKSILL